MIIFSKTGAVRSGYMFKKWLSEQDRASGRGSLDYVFVAMRRYYWIMSDVWLNWEIGKIRILEKYLNMIRNRAGMPNMDKSVYNTHKKSS